MTVLPNPFTDFNSAPKVSSGTEQAVAHEPAPVPVAAAEPFIDMEALYAEIVRDLEVRLA